MVKEEICDDATKLPHVNGLAVSWLESSFNLSENKPSNQSASINSISCQGSSKSNSENADKGNSRDNSNQRCVIGITNCSLVIDSIANY